jgi:hypothetical protein
LILQQPSAKHWINAPRQRLWNKDKKKSQTRRTGAAKATHKQYSAEEKPASRLESSVYRNDEII